MKRREFTAGVLGAGVLALPLAAGAQRRPEEGREYRTLTRRAPSDLPAGKFEVLEFFWYACPHCNAFEPQLQAWERQLAADVVLRRVPVAFRADFVPQQRLFYTLEAMGRLGDLHGKVFQAVHQDRQPTNRDDLVLAFAEKNGLDTARFQALYGSAEVAARVRQAQELQGAYDVEGVPALGIAGRYYTDGSMAGNLPRVLQLADYLLGEARRTR